MGHRPFLFWNANLALHRFCIGLIVLGQHLEVALGMVADGANFRG